MKGTLILNDEMGICKGFKGYLYTSEHLGNMGIDDRGISKRHLKKMYMNIKSR